MAAAHVERVALEVPAASGWARAEARRRANAKSHTNLTQGMRAAAHLKTAHTGHTDVALEK